MLLAIGSNGSGQLGIGHEEDTHIPTPCVLPADAPRGPPKQIVAGGNHTLVLYGCGAVYASGSNADGQCGITPISDCLNFNTFVRVPGPPEEKDGVGAKWEHISAGWEFSIFVSSNGRAYSCGRGNKGELGQGPEITVSAGLRLISGFPLCSRVVSIKSGMAHTLAVFSSGDIHGWGRGRKGQLGAPALVSVDSPRKVEVDFAVGDAACGREFSFVISADGARHQILGEGGKHRISQSCPDQGTLAKWTAVQASWSGVYVLLADGDIVAWGRNDRGQLPPKGLKGVEKLAVGSEHGLALVRTRPKNGLMAVAWGWGEHGNCGRNREEPGGGDVIDSTLEISTNIDLQGISAHCATSWFYGEQRCALG